MITCIVNVFLPHAHTHTHLSPLNMMTSITQIRQRYARPPKQSIRSIDRLISHQIQKLGRYPPGQKRKSLVQISGKLVFQADRDLDVHAT